MVAQKTSPKRALDLLDSLTTHDPPTCTVLFIYCRLNGPLFFIDVVDVAGLIGGLGLDCDISLPTVEQVVDFPFIKNRNSPGTEKKSPLDMLKDLMSDLSSRPAEGLYWVAACVPCTAFQMLSFARVESGIVVALDIEAGVIKLESQLSPRSFVLTKACYLTGGIPFYSWFKADTSKSIAAGD
ncbi:hypothetical protein BKA56DRAFT_675949 [Ilyonectria sp. MPI-CAGE-AT-0026]|nr:hypothetical protein BKA56DRAFT_675949 [Ilyonectria sp. MPI-CAGE-AT-0026]